MAALDGLRVLDLATVSIVGGIVGSAVVLAATLWLARGAVSYGWDLDNVNAPLVSTLGVGELQLQEQRVVPVERLLVRGHVLLLVRFDMGHRLGAVHEAHLRSWKQPIQTINMQIPVRFSHILPCTAALFATAAPPATIQRRRSGARRADADLPGKGLPATIAPLSRQPQRHVRTDHLTRPPG